MSAITLLIISLGTVHNAMKTIMSCGVFKFTDFHPTPHDKARMSTFIDKLYKDGRIFKGQ